MNTAGAEAYPYARPGGEAGRDKLELILHLLANLPQSLLLLAPRGAGKTALMRQIQAQALPSWTVYYLLATPNHGFERILDEISHMLRRPGQPAVSGDPESVLTEQLEQLERQGRALILLLDEAGVLMPGLLSALCRYARLHGALKLVFSLRPEELKDKAIGDALALADAHPVCLPGTATLDTAPGGRALPHFAVPAVSAPSYGEAVRGLWARCRSRPVYWLGAGAVVLAVIAGAMVHFLWREVPRPPTETAAPPTVPPTTVAPAPPEPRIEPQAMPAQPAVPEPKPPEPAPAAASAPEAAASPPAEAEAPEAAQKEAPKPATKPKKKRRK